MPGVHASLGQMDRAERRGGVGTGGPRDGWPARRVFVRPRRRPRSGRGAKLAEAPEAPLLEDLEQGQVDPSGERGALRDERGEAADRVRAGLEGGERLDRRVDAARGDQADARADGPAELPDGREDGGEQLRPGETARALRQPRLLDAARVAEVDRVDARVEGRRDDRAPILVGIVGRDLQDERLPRGLADQAEERADPLGRAGQLVDEPGVR